MTRIARWLLFSLVLTATFGSQAKANIITAADCNTANVQNAVNSANKGDTIVIPPGTCTWSSGVSISGKILQGSGSGRVILTSATSLTIGAGTQTLTVLSAAVGKVPSVAVGTTVRLIQTGNNANWMQGTVTSYAPPAPYSPPSPPTTGSLTINVTNTSGSGSAPMWLVTTTPTTIIINTATSGQLFNVSEDSTVHTDVCCFKVQNSAGSANIFVINSSGTNLPVLLHDMWLEQTGTPGDDIFTSGNRGVISNVSFTSSPFSMQPIAIHMKNPNNVSSWLATATWGSSDTNGTNELFIESSDFHAYLNATDMDDNSRSVFRYNYMNNSGFGTHGADTSTIGQRYFEYYNNVGIFTVAGVNTFDMNWWIYLRGGTAVVHDNSLPNLFSSQWGQKAVINMTVMNLQRNSGPDPCWGQGTTNGALYYAPRQVGLGRVTGTGHDGMGRTSDSVTYVGDSEPMYIWNNDTVPLVHVSTSDFGQCTSPDTSGNYIKSGRDYFNSTTPKPGYTPFTYPHPLTQGGATSSPASPTNLQVVVQ